MRARYLIRFDDICPTMNWEMWSRIEPVLVEQEIHPLLAVIPDNQDEKLRLAPPHWFFWEQVRAWQARGWTIGLHGYQHRTLTQQAGMVGIQRRSEFAGLPPAEQEEKLRRAVEIFRSHGVEPQVWIAPFHSFDGDTVAALQKLGIVTINGGLALAPHADSRGLLWVPQQLWKFRWRPFGVWTVCYHHNVWQGPQFARFLREVSAYRGAITDLPEVSARHGGRQHTLLDDAYRVAHSAVWSWRGRKRASA
jgi:peptidoglycan/xylan/chitin deacetylase (PgdA/CDA1 family)